MEDQGLATEGRVDMKKGVPFLLSFILCGCGVDNIFGTIEQQATWIALFVILGICAFGLSDR